VSRTHVITLIILGAVFWFLAAMPVRYVPSIFDAGWWSVVLLVGSLPGAWAFIKLVLWIVRLPDQRSLMAISIATITALFLDGLAMTWVPQLYGGDPGAALRGAGWILFGVGALWLSGLVLQRRAES
jgi:hypothetical protein